MPEWSNPTLKLTNRYTLFCYVIIFYLIESMCVHTRGSHRPDSTSFADCSSSRELRRFCGQLESRLIPARQSHLQTLDFYKRLARSVPLLGSMAANRFGVDATLQLLDTSLDNTPQSDEEQGSPEPSSIELEAASGDPGGEESQILEPRSEEEDSGHTGDSVLETEMDELEEDEGGHTGDEDGDVLMEPGSEEDDGGSTEDQLAGGGAENSEDSEEDSTKSADDDSNGVEQTPKSRKRLRNLTKWKKIKRIKRRNSGQRYTSTRGKEV